MINWVKNKKEGSIKKIAFEYQKSKAPNVKVGVVARFNFIFKLILFLVSYIKKD
jgi:hypothetical protein